MAVIEQEPTPSRTGRGADLMKIGLPPLLIFIAFLVLWQLQVWHRLLNIQLFQLPLPSQIAASFSEFLEGALRARKPAYWLRGED